MKKLSEKLPQLALGVILILTLLLLNGCASAMLTERRVYVGISIPDSLLEECGVSKPPKREGMKNKELPLAEDNALTDKEICNAQLRLAREYQADMLKEVAKRNERKEP